MEYRIDIYIQSTQMVEQSKHNETTTLQNNKKIMIWCEACFHISFGSFVMDLFTIGKGLVSVTLVHDDLSKLHMST